MLIGLVGYKGSGKSTVAKYLCDKYAFTPIKFAGPLKDMFRAFYRSIGLYDAEIERRIEGDLKEVPDPFLNGRTPRYAMQTLGTEWGRDLIAKDFWIDTFTRRVANYKEFAPLVVDDCRFTNEVAAIQKVGGLIVKVWRPDLKPDLSHPSEAEIALLPQDVIVSNDADFATLYHNVDAMVRSFGSDAA